jgi:hypothetical protein
MFGPQQFWNMAHEEKRLKTGANSTQTQPQLGARSFSPLPLARPLRRVSRVPAVIFVPAAAESPTQKPPGWRSLDET